MQAYGQVAICRLVHGGKQIVLLYLYSDKKKMNSVQKKEEALHCYNCHRQFYLVKPEVLKKISTYIDANCQSLANPLGTFGEDNYELATKFGSPNVCKLDDKSGKVFLSDLKRWIQQSSFSKDCKGIIGSLEEGFIRPW